MGLPPDRFTDRSATLTGFELNSYLRRKTEVTGKLVELSNKFRCWSLMGRLREQEWEFYSHSHSPAVGMIVDFLALSMSGSWSVREKSIFGYVVLVDEEIILIEGEEFAKTSSLFNEV